MRRFYGYDANGNKWRFVVNGATSWVCGNFYHNVEIQHKDGSRYETIEAIDVHACENAYEAACYAASRYDVEVA